MATKLRDSCETCGWAKVRCSKDKPACARCQERGIVCEYGASKRTGRAATRDPYKSGRSKNGKDNGLPNNKTTPTAHASATGVLPTKTGIMINNVDLTVQPDAMDITQNSLTLQPDGVNLIRSNLNMQPDSIDMTQTSSGYVPNNAQSMDDPMSGIVSDQSLLSMLDCDMENWQLSSAADMSLWGMADDMFQGEDSCSKPESCCLLDAMDLLRQLSLADALKGCGRRKDEETDQSVVASFQAAASTSKHTLDALNTILDCRCSYNGNLLTILFLVTLKLVACYAAVAHDAQKKSVESPPSDRPETSRANSGSETSLIANGLLRDLPPSFGNLFSPRNDPQDERCRVTAQDILEELYRIQDLGKRISSRVSQSIPFRSTNNDLSDDAKDHPDFAMAVSNVAPLLDHRVATHYANSLNQRLRSVSFHLIRILVQD